MKDTIQKKYFFPDGFRKNNLPFDIFEAKKIINDELKTKYIKVDTNIEYSLQNPFLRSSIKKELLFLLNEMINPGNHRVQSITPISSLKNFIYLESYIPKTIFDQYLSSSCYANAVALNLCISYGRKLDRKYHMSDIPSLLDYWKPSFAYIEYMYKYFIMSYLDQYPLMGGGDPNVAFYIIEKWNGCCLENQFLPPILYKVAFDLRNQFGDQWENKFIESYPKDIQDGMLNEFTQKMVGPISAEYSQLAVLNGIYNDITFRYVLFPEERGIMMMDSENQLFGLAQKKDANNEYLYFDNKNRITTVPTGIGVPKYSWMDRIHLYKTYLNHGLAICFSFPIFDNFNSKSNVIPIPTPHSKQISGHAVNLIGYQDETQYFIVQNSWGQSTYKGIYYLPYAWIRYLQDPDSIRNRFAEYISGASCSLYKEEVSMIFK